MLSNPGLSVIFWIMVLAKGFNYALNQPSIQQLYIPTSKDSRYKAKAWSDMFGSRSAKAMGSTINATKKKFVSAIGPIDGAIRFLRISSYISLVLVVVWFIIAPILGRVCKRAVDKDETVC
jgi:AAA family ATP:ADP antiporter